MMKSFGLVSDIETEMSLRPLHRNIGHGWTKAFSTLQDIPEDRGKHDDIVVLMVHSGI